MSRTYIDGKVTLVADIFDDLMEAALALDAARARPDEAGLRAKIEALPEMVGEPNDGGWSLVRRSDVLAALRAAQPEDDVLDVERLARALNGTVGHVGWLRSALAGSVEEWRENARIIAAEYARLSESSEGSEDRHEGPTARDCPECERLHEGVERRDGA